MGRRAKKAAVVTKKKAKLSKLFKCAFCAHDDVVECKMDMKAGIGSLSCRMCGASYQMPIHHLHEPVDVFSEWLDDCEAAHNRSRTQQQLGSASAMYEDDNDELPESSGLGSRKPAAKKANPKNDPRAASIDLGLDDSEDDDDED